MRDATNPVGLRFVLLYIGCYIFSLTLCKYFFIYHTIDPADTFHSFPAHAVNLLFLFTKFLIDICLLTSFDLYVMSNQIIMIYSTRNNSTVWHTLILSKVASWKLRRASRK